MRSRPTQSLRPIHQQRRSFLPYYRPLPPQTSKQAGFLVAQGLVIVLLADLALATLHGTPTTVRSVCQSAGFWKDDPDGEFIRTHEKDGNRWARVKTPPSGGT